MNQTLQDCIDGAISPEIAVAHLMFVGAGPDTIADTIIAALDEAGPHPRLDAVRTLLQQHEPQIEALTAHVAATVEDHNAFGDTPEQGIARIAGFFDRAVAASPEASVALYSLGDPAILAAATAEIVEWLEMADLLAPAAPLGANVLDLGCGIGRVATALACRCRSVLGLDVSPGMIAEARRRAAGLSNLQFEVTAGQNLAFLDSASLDLILAIDSFPYLVQANIAAHHLADAARILRPGGHLVILNLSYEGDAYDRAQAAEWATTFNLHLTHADAHPFRLWDGSAYVLRK
ncbi:MAG: class I SAM-dependent methyltransferase [Acetobacteraceae bacterium]|nr:class I SAM-dependent methyltransferase [Acetobacteraceae bacterium]